jgi:HSF-type DNA-binding
MAANLSGNQSIELSPCNKSNMAPNALCLSLTLFRDILPHYFRMSTFSSFQRQLNLYDFQRIGEGPEKGAYWHELFLKHQPMLSTGMKRNKAKGVTRACQEERMKLYLQGGGHPPMDPHVGC